MKVYLVLFLLFSCRLGMAQDSNSLQNTALKKRILNSKELVAWQHAMIAYQESNLDFCALKSEQKINQALYVGCGKPGISDLYKEFTLKFFRTMRITDELRDAVTLKEKALRNKYPQIATHFKFDDIFPEVYAPIQKARQNVKKKSSK